MTVEDMLIADEGLTLRYAADPQYGVVIGYGRNITTHPWFANEITYFEKRYGADWQSSIRDHGIDRTDAEMLLIDDIRSLTGSLRVYRWFAALDEVRQAVLIAMAYEMGLTGLLHFPHMLAAIAQRDFAQARKHGLNSDWAHNPLTQRRAQREMQMLATGEWPNLKGGNMMMLSDEIPWWQSRGIWGALVATVAGAAGLALHIGIDQKQQAEIIDILINGAVVVASLVAWYGRLRAQHRVMPKLLPRQKSLTRGTVP